MICDQKVILTNVELAESLFSLPEKKRKEDGLFFRYYNSEEGNRNCKI